MSYPELILVLAGVPAFIALAAGLGILLPRFCERRRGGSPSPGRCEHCFYRVASVALVTDMNSYGREAYILRATCVCRYCHGLFETDDDSAVFDQWYRNEQKGAAK